VTGYRLRDVSCWMQDFRFPGDEPVVVSGPHNHLTGRNPQHGHHLSTPIRAGTHVQGPGSSRPTARRSTRFR
jgi:hypothetical protein